MDFLTSWITNIIIFILLAVIIEMLLPQTALQKYVKMVLGLLLIAIILSPIFKLFSTDFEKILTDTTTAIQENLYSSDENSYENKKIEIQEEHSAYILKQIAVQLEQMSEKELIDRFGYQFEKIELQVNDQQSTFDHIETITGNIDQIFVYLTEPKSDEHQIEAVEEVSIDLNERNIDTPQPLSEPITKFLAEKWGVDEEIIQINIEERGGL